MPYETPVVNVANTAVKTYVESGNGYYFAIYSASNTLLVALPMSPATIDGNTAALTWQGSSSAAASATGIPSYAVVVRQDTPNVDCIILPVQQGSSPTEGVCVMDLNPFEIVAGVEYVLDSVTIPGV